MIYTLTLNTAIDMNIRCSGLAPNTVNRTSHTEYSPNGKAINVSIVLKRFSIASTAMGFFGGFSGKYIFDEMIKRDITTKPCWVDDMTRINVFINDGKDEYKLVGKGPFIPEDKKTEMLQQLESLTDCTHLVISGSLPNNVEPEFYTHILTLCERKKIEVILDISHPKLQELLAYKPLLIKPNDDEVKEIFGLETKTEEQILFALQQIHAQGARNILLTLGDKGLYFSNGQHVWFCNSVKIKLVSSACAGDAALAAFLSEWLSASTNQESIELAIKKASATGANVAESDGLGLLDKVTTYMHQLTVTQIK
ncbi:1-phosphofructokinase [Zophobihabitans entericus]|uniref:Phosphofructokinase n=1 Tax=Zophobihabitans entericus TaxID=1635327 RepID=A0A6G9IDF9_9GAMM|nr:1-phosphofructokinase [Zophobihabitans entericus]QIQ21849.1 1-phosphofructokinase [Zophobihabitans entericus]